MRAENEATMLSPYVQKTSRQDKIQEACKVRNDDWTETFWGRLEFEQNLHAVDAVYHQACSVKHGNDTDSEGRPTDTVKSKAFLKVTGVLQVHHHFTLTFLIADSLSSHGFCSP